MDIEFHKDFFYIYWDYHMVFILQFVNVHYINWLRIASHPYIPGIRPIRSCHLILLMYYWIWLANILLRIFASTFISDTALLFFFLDIFVWFWYRYWPHRMSLAAFFPPQLFGIAWEGYVLTVLQCLVEFTCDAIWLLTYVCWKLFMTIYYVMNILVINYIFHHLC